MQGICNDRVIKVPLTRGFIAVIDACDSDLAAYKWTAHISKSGNIYAKRWIKIDGKQRPVYMHRVVLQRVLDRALTRTDEVDHWDGDGRNNCRQNLRLATREQNARNSRSGRKTQSGFKGVDHQKKSGRWRASISVGNVRKHLGIFDTPEEALIAYQEAVKFYHGEFAYRQGVQL